MYLAAHGEKFRRWTAVNVKLLLPPRQSRGNSHFGLEPRFSITARVKRGTREDALEAPLPHLASEGNNRRDNRTLSTLPRTTLRDASNHQHLPLGPDLRSDAMRALVSHAKRALKFFAAYATAAFRMRSNFVPNRLSMGAAQRKSFADPAHSRKDQIDAQESSNHPQTRTGQLRENKRADSK